MTTNEATRRQVFAATPSNSTWVAANAGSGKTRVLTDRVARLLLAGCDPQKILCLTYTKAAASEMQNRLFQRLGSWTMLPDQALSRELEALGGSQGQDHDLDNARTLFARAIETPGGLKIQTIHAFCASILRRFPLEAGVSPQFRELDERLAKLMQRDALNEVAELDTTGAVDLWMTQAGAGILSDGLADVVRNAHALKQPRRRTEIWNWFGLNDSYSEADVLNAAVLSGDAAMFDRVAAALRNSTKSTDLKLADALTNLPMGRGDISLVPILESALLTGPAAASPYSPKSTPPTKDGRSLVADTDLEHFHSVQLRLSDLRPKRLSLIVAQKTWALHNFAGVYLPVYLERKRQGSWLDFDDLIQNARTLLEDPSVAAWVLFRLDGGIDHILVDEAQDTSPDQWSVIKQLAAEFTAGEGARAGAERTIFVVGDKKQSIYSFQGADPRAFDEMRSVFSGELDQIGRPLQSVSLDHSFRSSRAVLDCVDATFGGPMDDGLGDESSHIAFHEQMPGRVDLWPVEPVSESSLPAWHETVDHVGNEDPRRKLANRIASDVQRMIREESISDGEGVRPVRPSDILILVQGRISGMFAEVIRACKAIGLPMAGADRMNVAQELAVRDLTALLSFVATPEDDLSLAAVLKSPLFGWDEQTLFDLAHRRVQTFLWPALRDRKDEFPEVVSVLQDLLNQADFLRPFELLERILIRHNGRALLIGRLGTEAEDAIDALLGQALNYESSEVPSLTGFLTWLQADELSIKRATDSSANVIRVMTVHGAKGLEAPIVILADTAKKNARAPDNMFVEDGLTVWAPKKDELPPKLRKAYDDRAKRLADERQRLLYVAMTRAANWLIVAAAGDIGKDTSSSWYNQVKAGLEALGASRGLDGGLRYEPLGWPDPSSKTGTFTNPGTRSRLELPKIVTPVDDNVIKSPSDLGGSKVMAGTEADPDSTDRGTAIHRLLEVLPGLPATDRSSSAKKLLADLGLDIDQAAVAAEVASILDNDDLSHVFGPGTLSEVPITATLSDGSRFHGVIDRLVVSDTDILVVDFKSNTLVPSQVEEVPEGILRQMGAYLEMAGQVYPDRSIEVAILWTATGQLMHLPHHTVRNAFERATAS